MPNRKVSVLQLNMKEIPRLARRMLGFINNITYDYLSCLESKHCFKTELANNLKSE